MWAVWRIFMNFHSRSSISPRKWPRREFQKCKDSFWRSAGQLFRETERLISGQTENTGIKPDMTLKISGGYRQACCTVELIKMPLPRVYAFSDSVLCLGRMGNNPIESWKNQIQWYSENNNFDICAQNVPQHKENVMRLRDEFMANSKQSYKPIHPSNQQRQNPYQQFEGSEEYDYVVDRRTGWKW